MKWLNKSGKEFSFADKRYLINWDKPAPSKGSQEVKDFLGANYRFWTWFEEYRVPGTKLKVDFLSTTSKVAIEFHGRQHSQFVKHWHGSKSGFLGHIKRDVKKEELLLKNGFCFIELYDEDLELLSKSWFESRLAGQV